MADRDGGSNLLDAIAHPTVVNPLEAYGQAARVASGIWANREMQAKQLAGQAQQGAIDPDGVYQPNRAGQLLSQAGPGAALAAGQTLESSQRLSDQQLAQAKAKLGWVSAASGAALETGDYSDAAMMRIFQTGMANGMLTLPEVQKQMALIPPDAAGRERYLREHQMTAAQVTTQLERTHGTRPQINTGPTTEFPVVPPPQRSGAPGPSVGMGMSPEASGAVVVIGKDANGLEIKGTAQQAKNIAEGRGLNDNGPAGASPLGTGRLPPAMYNPNKPAAAPATSPAAPPGVTPLPGGGFTTGQTPADKTAQEASASAGTAAFQKISEQGVAAKSRGAVLDNMLADTTQFTSGPLAAQIAKARAYAQRLGLSVNTEGLSAVESFQKLAAQLNTSQGSDARLAVSEASNPHADLSPAGIDLMIRQLRGNEDYNLARAKLGEAHPDQKDSRGFEANTAVNLDPRVFQYERMKPEQRATYFKALPDKDAFIKAHDWAAGKKLFGG